MLSDNSDVKRIFSEDNKWFITAIGPKAGDGSDFYHYLIDYMNKWGFRTINTMSKGYWKILFF